MIVNNRYVVCTCPHSQGLEESKYYGEESEGGTNWGEEVLAQTPSSAGLSLVVTLMDR